MLIQHPEIDTYAKHPFLFVDKKDLSPIGGYTRFYPSQCKLFVYLSTHFSQLLNTHPIILRFKRFQALIYQVKMVSKPVKSQYTCWFSKQVLVLITKLRPTSLLNRIATSLRSLNPTSDTKQWRSGP